MVWSEMTVRAPLLKKGAVINIGKVHVCGNERSFAGVSVLMAASCNILPREAEVGENKMPFSPMCFCPHRHFHSCLLTLGGPINKVMC